MTKLLNRLSEELYELRMFICDEEQRIKTLEYEKSKLEINEKRLYDKIVGRNEKLTDEEDKRNKEIDEIRSNNKFINEHNPHALEFEKRKLEALKKYLKEQEENLTDLIRLRLI